MGPQSTTIRITKTFENTVDNTISHLALYTNENDVIDRVMALINHFEAHVLDNPYIYSRCIELTQLGVTSVREFNYDGFRILYEVQKNRDDSLTIEVLLLLLQNQSIQNQLIEHCLLYK